MPGGSLPVGDGRRSGVGAEVEHVASVLDEIPDRQARANLDRPRHRRPAVLPLVVRVGARLEQHADHLVPDPRRAGLDCHEQRRGVVGAHLLGRRLVPRHDQHGQVDRVLLHREVDRREAPSQGLHLRVGAPVEQQLHHAGVAVRGRHVQRRPACLRVVGVGVAPLVQPDLHSGVVAAEDLPEDVAGHRGVLLVHLGDGLEDLLRELRGPVLLGSAPLVVHALAGGLHVSAHRKHLLLPLLVDPLLERVRAPGDAGDAGDFRRLGRLR
mmetsp:Transcript_74440/g.218035  ORF Transcript_74440/g.218035 Transcript_74440/m.218035 type:complete len:268 (+) Transcript_74440:200-1003(+)